MKFSSQAVSKLAIAAVIGGLSFSLAGCATSPVAANDAGATEQHQTRQSHVEDRIQSLHDKLEITDAQEAQWAGVADVMRKNESVLHQLVEDRHAAESANAVEDLKSYERIAETHADAVSRLIPPFSALYNTLSDDQKKKADKLFSHFEGRGHDMHHKGHKHAHAHATPKEDNGDNKVTQ